MPAAADTSDSGRPLYAEPAQAHTLIAQGADVGAKAGAQGPAGAASSLPGTAAGALASSPFDAAVQAAQISLPQQDSAATMAVASSSETHAGGSEASVTSVTATDTDYAGDFAQVESQMPAGEIFTI